MATSVVAAPPASGIVLNRQARGAWASAAREAHPRCFIVGPASSGKSTLLRLCADALREAGRTVVPLGADTDPGAVPGRDVLLVDGLHQLDAGRLAAVVARASDPRAGLLVASRPWPRPDLAVEVARLLGGETPPVVLGQVARSDVLAHLDDQGRALPSACLAHLLAATGGLTWLVAHALAGHDPRDCADDPGHAALDRAVEAQVAHRLDTVPAAVRRTVEHVALAPEAALTLLPPWASGEAIERAYAEGLLLRDGSAPPVVRAAALAGRPGRRGGDPGTSPAPHDFVVRQALDAWAAGDLAATAGTIEALPPNASLTTPDAVTELAGAVWAARGMMSTASDLYAARPPARGSSAAAGAVVAHVGAGSVDHLPGPDAAAPAAGGAAPTTAGIALRLLERGLLSSLGPRADAGALTDLVRAAELHAHGIGSRGPLPELPAVIAASVAIGSGHVTTARHVVDAAVAAAPPEAWDRRRLLLWQAWVAMQAEQPAAARAAFAAADGLRGPVSPRDTLLLESVRVGMARRYDTLAALAAVWHEARERVRHLDVDLYSALPLTTLVTAAARVGDAETLAPHAARVLSIVQALGCPPAWGTQVWWAGVQEGILLNQPERLAPHARALVAAASSNPLARVMARAGGVWVAVLAGSVDADAVEEAARDLAASGLAWDGARLAGHGSRRAEDRRVVTRLLSVARELHPRESGTRAENGQPTDAAVPATNGVLSQREVDVAVLVLEGKTYNEIGETIFISPKTVEHHVAHIRRRLGATSRSDLMAKLRVLIEELHDASP